MHEAWTESDDDSSTIDGGSEELEGTEHERNSDAVSECESDNSSAPKSLSRENRYKSSGDECEEAHQKKRQRFKDEVQKPKEKEESKQEVLGSKTLAAMQVERSEHEVLIRLID